MECASRKFRYNHRAPVQQTLELSPEIPTVNVNINTGTGTVEAHPSVSGSVKRCSCCGRVLPVSQFWRDSSRSDGLSNKCVECEHEKAEERRRRKAVSTLLPEISDDELIEEMKRRGFRGTLERITTKGVTL